MQMVGIGRLVGWLFFIGTRSPVGHATRVQMIKKYIWCTDMRVTLI